MSKWEDRIQNSATYTAAKKLLARFDEVDLGNVSLEAIDAINRARLVIELLVDRLDNTDSRLLSISILTISAVTFQMQVRVLITGKTLAMICI